MIIENVGVNRAPVQIRLSGRVGDSGRDTFENENLIKPNKFFGMIIENVGFRLGSANRVESGIRVVTLLKTKI